MFPVALFEIQSLAATIGLALGIWWCLTVGRRWSQDPVNRSFGDLRSESGHEILDVQSRAS